MSGKNEPLASDRAIDAINLPIPAGQDSIREWRASTRTFVTLRLVPASITSVTTVSGFGASPTIGQVPLPELIKT